MFYMPLVVSFASIISLYGIGLKKLRTSHPSGSRRENQPILTGDFIRFWPVAAKTST
jgi:hypothetical protein